MTHWQERDVDTNGIRLRYYRGGRGAPVVLAHGFSDNGLCWAHVAEVLAGEYDVTMYDARGHGRSTAPERCYAAHDQAADLIGLVEALGLEQPALVGHSMGAVTTLLTIARRPDLARCAVLEDPVPALLWPPPANENHKDVWAPMLAWLQSMQTKTREELIAEGRTYFPGWSEAELEPWADSKLQVSPNISTIGDTPPVDWHDVLPNITCPVLLITGDIMLGSLMSADHAGQLGRLVPSLNTVNIPGAGHMISHAQFDTYIATLQRFLREHSP